MKLKSVEDLDFRQVKNNINLLEKISQHFKIAKSPNVDEG